MKKIIWITEDSFVDCDIIPIRQVSKYYKVVWVIVFPEINSRYSESEIKRYHQDCPNVQVEFFNNRYGAKDIRKVKDFWNLGSMANALNGDIYYVNYSVGLPWYFLFWNKLPRYRKIITAHQGVVHAGMKNKWLANLSRDLIYRHALFVNMFSSSQAELFLKKYKNSKVDVINLALKNYGTPTINKSSSNDNCVRFLSFGIVNYAKNVDLLIDAACNLYETGVKDFKVMIYGKCKDWSYYQKHIRYPEIFESNIGFVSNDDIPNLMYKAHYFVQPYRAVSQSGAMKVAFQYNVPVIASNLPGLKDEIEEGVNGFSFISENVKDLERVMKERIECFHKEYDALCASMKCFTEEHYSEKSIGQKYIQMFNRVINSLI